MLIRIVLIMLFVTNNVFANAKNDIIDDCRIHGHYTTLGAEKVKNNKDFKLDGTYDGLKDLCYKTYKSLYPKEYDIFIRKLNGANYDRRKQN